jgi:hypothetical protein
LDGGQQFLDVLDAQERIGSGDGTRRFRRALLEHGDRAGKRLFLFTQAHQFIPRNT